MTRSVAELTDYFIADAPDTNWASRLNEARRAHRAQDRAVLAAALTTRDPRPIPDDVLADLETLLSDERNARGTVNASDLPSLVEEGVAALPYGDRVSLWKGDLTRLSADAIVNAANDRMLGCFTPGHACIDNAIHAAAGPRLRQECADYMRRKGTREPTGRAVVTRGYCLPAAHVIHTVGPIVTGALTDSDRGLLAQSYRSILDAAHAHPDITTVGLCSISTGVFGFPKGPAAEICLATVADWFEKHPTSDLRLIISLFADVDATAYLQALHSFGRSS